MRSKFEFECVSQRDCPLLCLYFTWCMFKVVEMRLCYQRRQFTFLVVKGLDGGRDPTFPLLFHNDPASRTTVIDPYTFLFRIPFVFFVNTTSCAKILANLASRVAVKSRIPSRNFAFSRISRYISVKPHGLYTHSLPK